jgi:beta-mannosidase
MVALHWPNRANDVEVLSGVPVSIDLNGIWRLSWREVEEGLDVPSCGSAIEASVPGDVHEDLMRAGLLPEPLVGVNAPLHEWVERALFTYERDFSVSEDFDRAELVFHGLDCLAEVLIDGTLVGSSANAFVEHVFDVTPFVSKGLSHRLTVNLDTGVEWGKKQDHSNYQNGDAPERMFLRKSQFSFKWDWAPRLVTCGIWRGVELRLHSRAAIRDVFLSPVFEGTSATLTAKVEVEGFAAGEYRAKLRVVRGSSVWQRETDVSVSEGMTTVEIPVTIDPVERWYPNGYGDQALYDVCVEISGDGGTVDEWRTSYGFREVAIKREPVNGIEETFIITVNGVDVFCKGANWVPADSIVARVSRAKYETLVREAVEANFNMFRIWGGGIYENPVFYDLCDRLGIMIWHDFMFACSEYPDDQGWFRANVRDEAVKVVRSLRNHPSIALWCGNNENEWICGYYGRGKDGKCGEFHGQIIYHELLPEVCSALDPQRPYWPSSPFGGDDPNSEMCGDRHAWDVSIQEKDLAARADIRNYRKDRGKFNSEYGVLSYALPKTIIDYTGDLKVSFASPAYKVHDNHFNSGNVPGDESLTDWYLKVGFGGIPKDELTYIYQSLAYQAMGYREAISSFRIRKFECAGSMFWMYSDCWGTLGWTIVDYYLRRKPSFYWVRKAYAPLAVFVRPEDGAVRSYVVNDTLSEVPVRLTLEVGDLSGQGESIAEEIVVPANGVCEGPKLPCDAGYAFARIQRDGVAVSDDLILTRFPSEMEVPPVKVQMDIREAGDAVDVVLSSDGFGHFVRLDLPDGAIPTDNYFNMLPNRPKIIRVTGVRPEQIVVGGLNVVS